MHYSNMLRGVTTATEMKRLLQQEQYSKLWVIWKRYVIMHAHQYTHMNMHRQMHMQMHTLSQNSSVKDLHVLS